MTFLTPSGASCPVAPGQLVEIIFADGSRYIGPFILGDMTTAPGFVQGETGYPGRKFACSWIWRHRGDRIPVARYRLIGDLNMEHLRRIAAAPGPMVREDA